MSNTGGKSGGKRLDPLILSVEQLACPVVKKQKKPTQSTRSLAPVQPLTEESCGSDFLVLSLKQLIKSPDLGRAITQKPSAAPVDDTYELRLEKARKSIFTDDVVVEVSDPLPVTSANISRPTTPALKLDVKQIVGATVTAVSHTVMKTPIVTPEEPTQHTVIEATVEVHKAIQKEIEIAPLATSENIEETVKAVETVKTETNNNKTSSFKTAPRALEFSEANYVRVKIISHEINFADTTEDSPSSENITWMQRDAIEHYLAIQGIERRRAEAQGAVYRSFRHDA